MTDPQDPMARNKALAREHLHLVWQASQMGGELNDEDRRTAEVMREHPEHAHLWAQLDRLSDDEITKDGTNPILHIMMHTAVENQIARGDPPEAGEVVNTLARRGLSRHEAIHRVAEVLSGEIWRVLSEKHPSDPGRYAAKLAKMLRAQPAPPQPATRSVRRNPKRKR
jgi:hypothetical protein